MNTKESSFPTRSEIEKNYLLVEGSDDAHVCYHLFKTHKIKLVKDEKDLNKELETPSSPGIPALIIKEKGGVEKLLEDFEVSLVGSEVNKLGIIVDADDNLSNRWSSIRTILINSGYQTVPQHPNPQGTILKEPERVAVGVWLMPDNQVPGMIEDFCKKLIREDDILWKKAQEVVEAIITLKYHHFPLAQKIKAQMHTWLAWQEEPGKPMGQALAKKYLDPRAEQASIFVNWVRSLYELPRKI